MTANNKRYDVFLSYNSLDHAIVEQVAKELQARQCSSFIDRWYLKPGHDWVVALEHALQASRAVAVFLGPHEMGRWQQRERAWALDQLAAEEDFPVIPVLLPGCRPPLGFMKQLMWIDLRSDPTSAKELEALAAAIRGDRVDLDGQPNPRATICPYRGLLAFREEDADFLFGRDKYLKQLLDLVQRQTLVAVIGASGSGKSSLVSAGLVPKLRHNGDDSVWDVVRMVPHVDPLYSLAEALVPLIDPELSKLSLERELSAVANDLEQERPTTALWGLVNAVLRQQPGTQRLLLFVDQWEELYTNCEKPKRRERFVQELLEATSRKDSPLTVVLTVRGDFYNEILRDRSLLDRLQHAELKLGPMNAAELRSTIEGPAKVENVGLTFQDGLVDRILKEAGEEPGNLPLLEFAMEELWKRRDGVQLTHAGYVDLGRKSGQRDDLAQAETGGPLSRAIATYADAVFNELTPGEQRSLPALFRKLVRAGAKTEDDTRRRVGLKGLDETTRRVVRKLADKRMLMTTGEAEPSSTESRNTVEVAHEELLRRWGRLKEWVNDDRQFLLWRSRIDLKLDEYQRDGDAALLRGRSLLEAKRFYPARKVDLDVECRFLDASLNAERKRRLKTWGGICAVMIAVALLGGWWCEDRQRRTAETFIESLLATSASDVKFCMARLEPYANRAVKKLQDELKNETQPISRRRHAAFAIVRFEPVHSAALEFLLDDIPTLPRDEMTNLVSVLAPMHRATPLTESLKQRLNDAKSDAVRHRFLAVQLSLGITDQAAAVCELEADPTSRTSLILGFKEFPGDLASVAKTLEMTEDVELRSALCVAIGKLGAEAIETTQETLKKLFINAPDGGTHSAADWALRQQGLDHEGLLNLALSAPSGPQAQRGWEINKLNMTMLKIPSREFAMGPVEDDKNPSGNEPSEKFAAFWMSDREVSIGQFYAVLKRAKGPKSLGNPQLPMLEVSWFDAVEFCNELSRANGLAEPHFYRLSEIKRDEYGFVTNAKVTEAIGVGYRLPTEKEWEYACRAMSVTDYSFGSKESWLNQFAVSGQMDPQICCTMLPNGWGLFDMHGNAWEWCRNKSGGDDDSHVFRGGSNFIKSTFLHSASRVQMRAVYRDGGLGFRVSRNP